MDYYKKLFVLLVNRNIWWTQKHKFLCHWKSNENATEMIVSLRNLLRYYLLCKSSLISYLRTIKGKKKKKKKILELAWIEFYGRGGGRWKGSIVWLLIKWNDANYFEWLVIPFRYWETRDWKWLNLTRFDV